MYTNHDRQAHEHPTFNPCRFRSALALRSGSVEALARKACVSSRHIWHIVTNSRRGSPSVLQTIREVLGEQGFAFATGQADTLRDEGGDDVAR